MCSYRAKRFQIESFFRDKEATPAPLTHKLVKGGHTQRSRGYISYAHENGIANPTQYWHLMESWADRSKENATFGKNIRCGELVLRLHEEHPYQEAYTQGNSLIQRVCFDRMTEKVLNQTLLD